MSDKKIYPVLSAVRHDGAAYSPDDLENNKIELTEKEAKPLLSLKVIGDPMGDAEAPDLSTDGSSGKIQSVAPPPEERQQAILNAFPSLNASTDMTKAGEPKVKSVEALLGFDVSADEVKAAWAEVQAKAAANNPIGNE